MKLILFPFPRRTTVVRRGARIFRRIRFTVVDRRLGLFYARLTQRLIVLIAHFFAEHQITIYTTCTRLELSWKQSTQ
jgi:hypothetical protein